MYQHYQHRVKVFSESGIFEGLFLPQRSDEYNLGVFISDNSGEGLDIVWITPWEMVYKATFLPELRPVSYVEKKSSGANINV